MQWAGAIDFNVENIGVLENKQITVSFASEHSLTFEAGTVLFTLTADGSPSIDQDGYTNAEMYQGEQLDIHNIEFRSTSNQDEFYLAQNEPNPFSKETAIEFYLPSEVQVDFSVMDAGGKVILNESAFRPAGLNSIIITDKQLVGHSGILYYRIKNRFVC